MTASLRPHAGRGRPREWFGARALRGALAFGTAGLAGCGAPPGPETTEAAPAEVGAAAAERVAGARERIAAALATVPAEDLPGLERSIHLRTADPGLTGGAPLYTEAAEAPRPAASSIKTAYLVELFAERAEALDEPLPGAEGIVGDPKHPAVAHFDAETRAEIREHLARATARTVGRHLIRGDGVSNAVYNAAANLATAFLGGPRALTARIHERHPDFSGIEARRYMLAAREATGDNEATAASLAAVLVAIATGTVPGVGEGTHEALREVLFLEEEAAEKITEETGNDLEEATDEGEGGEARRHYFKGGSLNSDPITRVLSGYIRRPGDPPGSALVYVFMAELPGPGDREPAAAGTRLRDYLEALRAAALPPARAWLRSAAAGDPTPEAR